jgi:hypothetical protein
MKEGIRKMEKRGLQKCGTQILVNSRESAPSTKAAINETIQTLVCQ